MTDYRFEHVPVAPAGRVVFQMSNAGQREHALTLALLPADLKEPVDDLFEGGKGRAIGVTAQLFPKDPGTKGTFAVDLRPGRYVMVCFVTDLDGQQHFRKGMVSELRVQ